MLLFFADTQNNPTISLHLVSPKLSLLLFQYYSVQSNLITDQLLYVNVLCRKRNEITIFVLLKTFTKDKIYNYKAGLRNEKDS